MMQSLRKCNLCLTEAAAPREDHEQRPGKDRAGRVSLPFIIGAVLWAIVFAWFFIARPMMVKPNGSGTAADGVTETTAEATSDSPAEFDPDTVRFPSRELPEFSFESAHGETVTRDSLKGKPWVASFVFTRCMTTCPQITLAVKQLHDRLGKDHPDVRFVSFTVDPNYDTTDVLQQYAEVYSADPERWKFVTGEEAAIHALILKGFAQFVKPNVGEERRPGFEVAHTNRVVLVNEDAIPVATFLATRPEDMVKLRRILDGSDEFPQPGPPAREDEPAVAPPIDILRPVPKDGEGQSESGDTEPDDAPPEVSRAGGNSSRSDRTRQSESGSRVSEREIRETAGSTSSGTTVVRAQSPDAQPVNPAAAADARDTDVNRIIDERLPVWAARLPAVNAGLNSISTVLLLCGFVAIRKGQKNQHRNLMVSAFVVSVLFLVTYLTYHSALGRYTGEHGRAFEGPDWARYLYYAVLWPHVMLAATVPFLTIRLLWLAWKERWILHRRLARVTFPIWLYVSVTGVVIYLMLYHWPAVPAAGTPAAIGIPPLS